MHKTLARVSVNVYRNYINNATRKNKMHTYAIYQDSEIDLADTLSECVENVLQGFYGEAFNDVEFVIVHDSGIKTRMTGAVLRILTEA